MRSLLFLWFVGCTVFVLPALSAAEHWPEFRGPGGDGRADAASLPHVIEESGARWKTAIHGKGWSSPVVWGEQIWLTTATEDGTELSVVCVDRDNGEILHDKVVLKRQDPPFCHPTNSYASCTPAIEEGRVYVHFGSSLTACLDTATADILWQRSDLPCDHFRGPASSPILHGENLYVALDGVDKQYVVALDKKSGDTVWKTDRVIDYGTDNGDYKKAYGTASIIRVDGQEQLVYPAAVATIAYEPNSGDTLWTAYHGGMNASARPVLVDGLIYVINGFGKMVAIRTGGTGDITDSHVIWTAKTAVAKKASLLAIDSVLYMNSDDGVLSARRADDGQVLWRKRAGGAYAASPIYAGGLIYFFSSDGDIITIRPIGKDAKDDPTIVSHTQVGDGFNASPAVVDNDLILRSKSMLYCFRGTDSAESDAGE